MKRIEKSNPEEKLTAILKQEILYFPTVFRISDFLVRMGICTTDLGIRIRIGIQILHYSLVTFKMLTKNSFVPLTELSATLSYAQFA